MPLIGGGLPILMLEQYRQVWLAGRPGGGKTSLAFYLAYDLLRRGKVRYCLSNIPCVFADRLADVKPAYKESRMTLDAVIVLDEAGLYLKLARDTDFIAFVRKLNIVFIMPSVEDVATNLKSLIIEREFNAQTLGIPAWIYRYYYKSRRGIDHARFIWYKPAEIFGVYDTDAMPVDDNGISDFLQFWTAEAVQYYNKQKAADIDTWRANAAASANDQRLRKMEGSGRDDLGASIETVASQLENITSDFSLSMERIQKKRKRNRF